MRALHTLAFGCIIASACQPMSPRADTGAPPTQESPATGVTIDLDRTTYRAGDQVWLRVTNHTADQLGYNPCTRSIERRSNDSWALIVEPARVCTMQLFLLNAHASRTDATDLPSSLDRGTYRIALGFTRETPGVTPQTPASTIRAVSAPFQVE
jgi:hypothetical protein